MASGVGSKKPVDTKRRSQVRVSTIEVRTDRNAGGGGMGVVSTKNLRTRKGFLR